MNTECLVRTVPLIWWIVPGSTKPLPELVLISHQWGSVAFNREQFHMGNLNCYSVYWVWKWSFLTSLPYPPSTKESTPTWYISRGMSASPFSLKKNVRVGVSTLTWSIASLTSDGVTHSMIRSLYGKKWSSIGYLNKLYWFKCSKKSWGHYSNHLHWCEYRTTARSLSKPIMLI